MPPPPVVVLVLVVSAGIPVPTHVFCLHVRPLQHSCGRDGLVDPHCCDRCPAEAHTCAWRDCCWAEAEREGDANSAEDIPWTDWAEQHVTAREADNTANAAVILVEDMVLLGEMTFVRVVAFVPAN